MKKLYLLALAVYLASSLSVYAQSSRELHGRLFHKGENGEVIPERGVIVRLLETGNSDDTNDEGIFRLPMSSPMQPGDRVTLSTDKPGWRIRYPLDGEVIIPRDFAKEIISVEILPAGSQLFWTEDRLQHFLEKMADIQKIEGLREGEASIRRHLNFYIETWATEYGFTVQEVEGQVKAWAEKIKTRHGDPYLQALADFAAHRFDKAAQESLDAASLHIKDLKDAEGKVRQSKEDIIRDFRLSGSSHYFAYHFEKALEDYGKALSYASKEEVPELWAATLADIGTVYSTLGSVGPAAESARNFAQAISSFEEALSIRARDRMPQAWAESKNNLGNTLTNQGMRSPGKESADLLLEGIKVYRQALEVRTPDRLPLAWASTQGNLGLALWEQARRDPGEKGSVLLEEAVNAYKQIFRVLTPGQSPEQWAMAQIDYSLILEEQASRASVENGAKLLSQAVDACRGALRVESRKKNPQDWALIQNDLGIALQLQATHSSGEKAINYLNEAIDAYNQALQAFAKEEAPQQWALTEHNLGNAFLMRGQRAAGKQGLQFLSQAASAYEQALTVRTPGQLSRDWVQTENNLAIALKEQGTRTEGEEGIQLLAQSANAYRKCLSILKKEQFPVEWSFAQNNLGIALREQGQRTEGLPGIELLAQAAEALRQALTVRTREKLPLDWAGTQNSLGNTLREQAKRTEIKESIRLFSEAEEAHRNALLVFTKGQLPQQWAITQESLGNTLEAEGMRSTEREERTQLIAQAVTAYRQALLIFAPDSLSQYWLVTRSEEVRALLALERFDEAMEALIQVHARMPNEQWAFLSQVKILKDSLFDHARALALIREWLKDHPDDRQARVLYVEQLFTVRALDECRREIAALKEAAIEGESRIILLAFSLAIELSSDADGLNRLKEIITAVDAQQSKFFISWKLTGTLRSLDDIPKLPNSDLLVILFHALEKGDRASVLHDLQDLEEAMQAKPRVVECLGERLFTLTL